MVRKREIDSVDKLIHAVVARHYRSDGFGISCALVQSKCSGLKIFGDRQENQCLNQD
jgi:hypothetical protein